MSRRNFTGKDIIRKIHNQYNNQANPIKSEKYDFMKFVSEYTLSYDNGNCIYDFIDVIKHRIKGGIELAEHDASRCISLTINIEVAIRNCHMLVIPANDYDYDEYDESMIEETLLLYRSEVYNEIMDYILSFKDSNSENYLEYYKDIDFDHFASGLFDILKNTIQWNDVRKWDTLKQGWTFPMWPDKLKSFTIKI
jgi:hypothetical protein